MNVGDKPSLEVNNVPTLGFPMLEVRYDSEYHDYTKYAPTVAAIAPPESFWRKVWRILNTDVRVLYRQLRGKA